MKITNKKYFIMIAVFLVFIFGAINCGGGDGDSLDPDLDITTDTDSDGVYDASDNCIDVTNPGQEDADNDEVGDVCDVCPADWNPSQSTTGDDDSFPDGCDNCPDLSNDDQADMDKDGIGNVCDDDKDGDGYSNSADNCPDIANDQTNVDGDNYGADCDLDDNDPNYSVDADLDGVDDSVDNCPTVANPDQYNTDHDEYGNECDTDDDNDAEEGGCLDICDPYPLSPGLTCQNDDMVYPGGDGDRDDDGICDDFDNCPDLANINQLDTDCGDEEPTTVDDDGDTILNDVDNCVTVANTDQADYDGDNIGDACDQDVDADGLCDNAAADCTVIDPNEKYDNFWFYLYTSGSFSEYSSGSMMKFVSYTLELGTKIFVKSTGPSASKVPVASSSYKISVDGLVDSSQDDERDTYSTCPGYTVYPGQYGICIRRKQIIGAQ